MTLTSIIPSLRRTIPDPFSVNAWPEHTEVSTTDVTVCGVSLLRLVDLCQTPCVHIATGVIPGSNGRPSPHHDSAVVVVRVTSVLHEADTERIVLIDACLDAVHATWRETRLIGRASTAKSILATLRAGETAQSPCGARVAVALPSDVCEGDLLAIPCNSVPALRDVRTISATDAVSAPLTESLA